MLDQVTELFAPDRKKPATSVQIEKALEDIKAELGRKRDELTTLTKQQAEILLTGDEKAVDEHERTVQLANRDITRLTLVHGQLAEELGKARDREAKSDQDKLIRAAHRDHDRGVKLIEELAECVRRPVEILEELCAINKRLEGARRTAETFGRRDDVPTYPSNSVRPLQPDITRQFVIPKVLSPDSPSYMHNDGVMRYPDVLVGWKHPPKPQQPSKKIVRPAGAYDEDGNPIGHDAHLSGRRQRGIRHPGIQI